MKSTILSLAALVCCSNAMAESTSISQFCEDRASISLVKEMAIYPQNLMSFENHGGIGNKGVCWWHSRMQRNALYLSIYQPNEMLPTEKQAKEIVEKLRRGREIVVIPGVRNFEEFSIFYMSTIQRELEKWQKGDGVLKFNWVIGLKGRSSVSANQMRVMMDELYDYVENEGKIAYQKLQIKGVVAHAWLVINMIKIHDGYDLEIIDSNTPNQTTLYRYTHGMTHFNHFVFGDFVPYLERKGEMEKVINTILKICNPEEYKKRQGKVIADDEY